MPRSISISFLILLICVLAPNASAQEYCVACTGPEALYRCMIGGEATPGERSARGQILCIKELAKSGSHESCRVDRTSSGPCDGVPRTVIFPDVPGVPDEAFVPPPGTSEAPLGEEALTPPSDQEPLPENAIDNADPAQEGAPKTVVDMAKGTGKNLEKAGDAVGNAAKKTWTCLSSFFSDC
jgi:hypothetical protein